jgi:DNA helicase HerA-like ATPase
MKLETALEAASGLPNQERRARRALGHLVSLNGMHGVIACEMTGDASGDYWSVGNLISVVHESSRLVGVVCELETSDRQWRVDGTNLTLVKIELSGEIIDEAPGKPVFFRGIRSFPILGAIAHRIRAADLRAIFTIRGVVGVEIGHLTQNPSIQAMVSVEEMTKRHFAIVGSTGVGKTTSVAMLAKRCLSELPDMRVLIIDPHNEYAAHFREEAIVLDADTLDLPYWMFRFDEMLDIIYAGRKPNADEADALYEVIRAAKTRFSGSNSSRLSESPLRRQTQSETGWISADTPVPYRVNDAVQILEEWMGKLDPRYARADLRSLKNRLEALSHDPRFKFMFGKVVVEDVMAKVIGQIFRLPRAGVPVTIVQVAGLPNEVVNAVVSVLARLSFDVALWHSGKYQIVFLCEEAHRYIPSDSQQGFEPTRRAIGRIAKEGRKYGVSLGVVTQRPADLDSTVLSQCSTMFSMRLSNERDKQIVGAAAGVASAGTTSFLSSIADREAIAFGEAIATPMRMKFGDYREFEANRVRHPDRESEDGAKARNELRAIVSRMRGEIGSEPLAFKHGG